MASGYFQGFRDDFEMIGWDDAATTRVWALLLSWQRTKAELRPNGLLGVHLAAGQLATTVRVIMRKLAIKTKNVVERALAKLQALGLVELSPSEKGTLITVKAGHQSGRPKQPERPESSAVQDCVDLKQATPEAMKENGIGENVLNGLPAGARVRAYDGEGDEKDGTDLSETEVEFLREAAVKLGRCVSRNERERFIAKWRTCKWATVEKLRSSLEWFAKHQLARAETAYLERIFYAKQVRAAYAEKDAVMVRWLERELGYGRNAAELLDEAAASLSRAYGCTLGEAVAYVCARMPAQRAA